MASLRTLHPKAYPYAQAFVRWLQNGGLGRRVNVTVTSARRDPAQQAKLYARYRAGLSKYPAAPPGKSMHALGIAFDLVLDPPLYKQAGVAWERAGFTWGGRFADEIHFDFRPRA